MVDYRIYPGGINTPDGLTKSTSGDKLRRLLNENIFQIVTEIQKSEIRKRLPAAKHYIVYPETSQGEKNLGNSMRQKKRVGEIAQWEKEKARKSPLNSSKLQGGNSKRKY